MARTNSTFYYDRKKLGWLLLFNLVGLVLLVVFGTYLFHPLMAFGFLVLLLWFIATLASAHVYFFPQKLAVINDREIKIDRNVPLKWDDISTAEEIAVGCFGRRKIIVFKTVKNFKCPLTIMQHICRTSRYTPFSIPLYAMTKTDADDIRSLIAAHTKYNDKTGKK